LAIALSLSLAQFANAGCDLQIKSAGPCLADGSDGIPHVGDVYGLKVVIKIVGNPNQPFRIKWTLANVTYYYDNINVGPGDGWWWPFFWPMDLDDPIPWSVTLDPDGISGDTNLVNNTASGTFTPIPPSTAVDFYAPRMMRASETSLLSFGSGIIPNLWVIFGIPTTHGAQRAMTVTGPPNGRYVVAPPYNVPLFEIARTNVPGTMFQDTNFFTVQLNRVRVNPTLLRSVTWSNLDTMTTEWTQWLAPDLMCQSTNSQIASFVQQSLPANYQSSLTPYDTARTLHRAVMKKLTYGTPPPSGDAVSVLQAGVGDCGAFSALLTACLRNVGIPARRISGFRQGDTVWHIRVEFHLPGSEWLVADPTDGNGADPTGTYAHDFGCIANADSFLAVDTGDAHVMPYYNFVNLQVPNFLWNGGAALNSRICLSYLQGISALWPSNVNAGSFRFYMSDVPSTGSVVIETSTNLVGWLPVATNPAAGNPLSYSFSATNKPRSFFRAKMTP
jgi:transglutaminase-like putative cysteine protease